MSKEQVVVARKKKKKVKALRKTYNSFSDQEKAAVTNYKLLIDMEKTISQLLWYEFPATDIYTRWL